MSITKQYFMDGCFDGYHYGHVNAILQGKLLCDTLILGTHTNEEMTEHKNDPLYNYSERIFMLKYCKYIDMFVGNVNYIVSCETLDKFNCSKYLHGNEVLITRNGENGIDTNVINNRYITYETTNGISTTSLLLRLYNYSLKKEITFNNNFDYLTNIYDKTIKYNLINYNNSKKIIYLEHSWDLLNSIHIKHVQKIKDKYFEYNLVAVVSNYDNEIYIYNQLERAIILSSIKIIDNVIMKSEYINNDEIYINLNNINNEYFLNFNKNDYIMNINFNKFKKKINL